MPKPLKGMLSFRGFFIVGGILLALSSAGESAIARATDPRPRVLDFAIENSLAMAIGKFEPGKGWVQSTDFYSPPQPGDPVSLFGVKGKLGEVVIMDQHRPNPEGTYAGWSAHIERGLTMHQPYALAIQGSWPDAGVESEELPLNDADGERIASDFLKEHGLKVKTPFLTQAYKSDLTGDGHLATLVCAHSDLGALRDDQEGVIYALALLRGGPPGREETKVLAAQYSFKPAFRTIDEQKRYHGERDFYRFIAFHDIAGDGQREIVLYRAKDGSMQIDIFTFDGRRVRQVLSAYKPNYN
jgi:hypothetical protein